MRLENPKIEDYKRIPRANELRALCIEVVKNARLIMTEKDGREKEIRDAIYARLEQLQGELIQFGIVPEMHAGSLTEDDQKDPLKIAEWAAGQIYETCGEVIQTATAATLKLEEHDAIRGPIFDQSKAPSETRNFQRNLALTNFVLRCLDAEQECADWIAAHRNQ